MKSKIAPNKNRTQATMKRVIAAVEEFAKPFSEIVTSTLPISEPESERKKIDKLKYNGMGAPFAKASNSCTGIVYCS